MSAPPARILVIDDDAELRTLLLRYLGENGFDVRVAADAEHADRLLGREAFDLLVLDLMLPGEDGLSICRRMRAQGETLPIIMLTARGDPVDRVVGLEIGADDYVAKPFSPRELLARIQAMLRRQSMLGARPVSAGTGVARFGEFELDLATHVLTRNAAPVEITSSEFALLRAFVGNAGRPLSRERLIELAHGRGHDASDRSVDVQVLRLRRLIEPDPAKPRYIKTVWGTGYVFVGDAAA
ncbi:MAG TPA: two-component system response regulator OmpR [Burkholderiaceae bacterium]|nr:two-component system response regulator OmpR [Burkholderiaceae bacterium]